jgi:hypothetical protein
MPSASFPYPHMTRSGPRQFLSVAMQQTDAACAENW